MGIDFWVKLVPAVIFIAAGAVGARHSLSGMRRIPVASLILGCMSLVACALGASLVRDAVDPQGRNLLTERAYGLFMVSEEKRRWGVP